MIKGNELRIGNIVDWRYKSSPGIPTGLHFLRVFSLMFSGAACYPYMDNPALLEVINELPYYRLEPIPLTKEWLERFGFIEKADDSYINGFRYLKQVTGFYDEIDKDGIDRDGVWMEGIGTYSWKENKTLAVNTFCCGNYCSNSVKYVHQLQNLHFALTGEELQLKDNA